MASKIFLNLSKTNPKLLTGAITKTDQETLIKFDKAEIEVTDKGVSIYCNLINSPSNATFQNDGKWQDVQKADLPYQLLLNLPFKSKDVELIMAQALAKFTKEELSQATKFYCKGEISIEDSVEYIQNYLAGENIDKSKLTARYFDLALIEASEFDLPAIDKKAASGNNNRQGASAQTQLEKISDRITFLNSLEKPEERAKVISAHLHLEATLKEINPKASYELTDLINRLIQ